MDNIQKKLTSIMSEIFQTFITTLSFVALLPISSGGYQRGCAVALSIFILSKLIDTTKTFLSYRFEKYLSLVISLNIILTCFGLYIAWKDNVDTLTFIILVFLYIGALFFSYWDFFSLSCKIQEISIIDGVQQSVLQDAKNRGK